MADYKLGGEIARIEGAGCAIARQGPSGVPLLDFVLARPVRGKTAGTSP